MMSCNKYNNRVGNERKYICKNSKLEPKEERFAIVVKFGLMSITTLVELGKSGETRTLKSSTTKVSEGL